MTNPMTATHAARGRRAARAPEQQVGDVHRASPGSQRLQGGSGVGESVGRDPPSDQCAKLVVDVPNVDVHGGGDYLLTEPKGEEGAVVHVAAEDHLVPGLRVADILHAEFVLVGVKVGLPVVP